jgi:hypothetical protein
MSSRLKALSSLSKLSFHLQEVAEAALKTAPWALKNNLKKVKKK